MPTITDIFQDATKQICACIGIDTCYNWAVQRADGMVYNANKPNGEYIGIDAMRAPSGYVRLASEYDISTANVGSCRSVFEVSAEFVAVIWASRAGVPNKLLDKLMYDISRYKINGRQKPEITMNGASFVFDEIFKEETAMPEQFPAGLDIAKVSFTITYKVSACDITAPECGKTINPIVPNDPDAQALFDAITAEGGTVTDLQEKATNTAIIDLKAAGLWAKGYAFYFMIGGTAAAHKWNAKNPVNTDAAFRLSFAGGWLHSATGAQPNGVNAYANSYFTPSTNAAVNSLAMSYYSGSNAAGAYIEMGVLGNAISPSVGQLYIAPNVSGSGFLAVNVSGNAGIILQNPQAMFTTSRIDSIEMRLYRNELQMAANAGLPNSASNKPIYIGARNNNGTPDALSARECRFSAILSGLTAPETAAFYTIIEAFQTTQGRNN
jgi:hypothetical protein